MSVPINTRWVRWLGLAYALASVSCGGGSSGGSSSEANAPTPPASIRPTLLSDLQIAQLIYAGAPRTPEGFYAEAPLTSYTYVATEHLKNSDVAPAVASAPEFELCTDDWNQALSWSELDQQSSQQYADLVATNDDARFFEFGRIRPGEPQFYLRGRVFKCEYLDRHGNDLTSAAGPAGQLKATPIDAAELQQASEYLWQFTRYNNFGSAVLTSSGSNTSIGLKHSIITATLTRNPNGAPCDRVDVIDWRHDVNSASGELSRSVELLWSFTAREVGGGVELCT